MRSELLGKLLLLSNSILHSLLLSGHIFFILLLLGLHKFLALCLSLHEGFLFSLADLLDLLSGHAVWAVWVSAICIWKCATSIRVSSTVVWGSVRKEGHFDDWWLCSPH